MNKYDFKKWATVVFLFISYFFLNFENKANAQVDITGVIWCTPIHPEALPVNGSRSGNAGLNAAFDDFHVMTYTYVDSLYINGSDLKYPIYKIQLHPDYAHLGYELLEILKYCYDGFFLNLGLPYGHDYINGDQISNDNGFINIEFYEIEFDHSFRPASNTRSYNKHMNLILRKYDIKSYKYHPFVSYTSGDTLWRTIKVLCDKSDLLYLYYDLLTLNHKFDVMSIVLAHSIIFESSNPCGPYSGISDEVESTFKIFPNPAHDEISITGVIPESVILYDMMGRIVDSEYNSETNKIDIKHLPDGLYILKIISNDGKMYTNKIIKQ